MMQANRTDRGALGKATRPASVMAAPEFEKPTHEGEPQGKYTLFIEGAGCPMRCRHCWACGRPYGFLGIKRITEIIRDFDAG